MLLRLAYLTATNTLALLRLLPICDKGIEILALRHQPLVLQRQVGRPFADADRAALAGCWGPRSFVACGTNSSFARSCS